MISDILKQLTLEEKASLCSGKDFWHLEGFEHLDIPAIMVADGPHGLRKQDESQDHLGINDSIQATCFPTGVGAAATFSREYMARLGRALARQAKTVQLSVLLGPAVNIKRSPLCGRNFEYLSEDPYLAGTLAGAYVQAVEEAGVGTSLKHFAANNQEHRRMTSSSEVDERTLREIYFPPFEIPVREADPSTVMCSYNRINGVFSSNNDWLLNEVLRDEWGFDGIVMTDWGAIHDRVDDLVAGLDLEMPGSGGLNDREIVEAVRNGRLDEAVLDRTVERLLELIFELAPSGQAGELDLVGDHALAREMAAETMVLLKNDGVLPLAKDRKVALIGAFAKQPRYQGGGSSHVNAKLVDNAFDVFSEETDYQITYADGYRADTHETDDALLEEARATASAADVAVLFVGLPDAYESEGYDRIHLELPPGDTTLIEAVAAVQPRTVVVLHNGSPVTMPWLDRVAAVLEAYLGGEAAGGAVVDLLTGKKNPSARLAETFPVRLEQTPAWGNYPGYGDEVHYRETVYVGYRHYTTRHVPMLFPFGFGLSYSEYSYKNLRLSTAKLTEESADLTVSVDVENVGDHAGYEVVQVYVEPEARTVDRPLRELKAYDRVWLEPGETKTVELSLNYRSFAHYDVAAGDWAVAGGRYFIQVAEDSETILDEAAIEFAVESPLPVFTKDTVFGDLMEDPRTQPFVEQLMTLGSVSDIGDTESLSPEMAAAMLKAMPIRALINLSGGKFRFEEMEALYKASVLGE